MKSIHPSWDMDDWLVHISLISTIVLTASGGWYLATKLNLHPIAAGFLPAATDVYAVVAIRKRSYMDMALALPMVGSLFAVSHWIQHQADKIDPRIYELPVWVYPLVGMGLAFALWRTHELGGLQARPRKDRIWTRKTSPAVRPTVSVAKTSAPKTATTTPPIEKPKPAAIGRSSPTSSSANSPLSDPIEAAEKILADWPVGTKKPGHVALRNAVRRHYGLTLSEHHAKRLTKVATP